VSLAEQTQPVVLWLGLGQMGSVLASRLTAAFRVVGVDPSPAAYAEGLWRRVETVKDAVDGDLTPWAVLVCLPDPVGFTQAIAEVMAAPGVAQNASYVVNLSTVGPAVAAHAADVVQRSGKVEYVESLITGGVQHAAQGDITLLVAGSTGLSSDVRKMLGTLAVRLQEFENIEAVATAKLVNNVAMLGTASATLEAIDLGRRRGLELDVLFRVLRCGTANSYILNNSLRRLLLDHDRSTGFAARLALKDLDLALDLAARVGCDLSHARLVREELSELIGAGGGDETFARIGALRGIDSVSDLNRPATDRETIPG
jgi:3-hydroxyisobutyrate dehydrogenase